MSGGRAQGGSAAERTVGKQNQSAIQASQAAPSAQAPPIPVPDADITLLSPRLYQVFQRQSRQAGRIVISGRARVACDRIEARVLGKSVVGFLPGAWQPVTLYPVSQAFWASLPCSAGGWYRVEVRALRGAQTIAQTGVESVGIGEVFVGAGQSNGTNYGEERTQPTSGMVSSFSGAAWQLANDPQPGTHDKSQAGSFWPTFGDAMYQKYHVPIGVVVTGQGGASIRAWQPGGELFVWMMTRVLQLGPNGFRAILWHQGESDSGMASDDYAAQLTGVIEASKQQAGWEFPWFVAQASYHSARQPAFEGVRNAQKKLWDMGIALEGPDTDTLTGENRDHAGVGVHFSVVGLRAHGQMWAEKVGQYLDRALSAQIGRQTATRRE